MWDTILDILKDKAQEGVDVRVMYDDIGSMFTLPRDYARELEARTGIKCCVFNPFVPILSLRLNNRDHRKIMVIDGKVAFTGGINLADEYINEKGEIRPLEGQRHPSAGRGGLEHDGHVPDAVGLCAGKGHGGL